MREYIHSDLLERKRIPAVISEKPIAFTPWARLGKQTFDIVFAGLAMVFFLPLTVLIAAAIFAYDRGPLFCRQMRIGRNGEVFPRLKFRTMFVDAERRLARHLADNPAARIEWRVTQKLRHDPRVTPIGRILRISCFDGLPQFFNVLMGDMSVVGPRPIADNEVQKYGEKISVYESVKPGVIGLWRVNKRSTSAVDQRGVDMDVKYIKSMSLRTDLDIVLKTAKVVFSGST